MKKKLLILINCLLGIAPVYSWSMGRFVRFGTRAAQARSWSRAGGTWQRSSSVLSSTDKWRQRQSHWSSPSYKVPLLLGAAAALGATQRVYAQEEEDKSPSEGLDAISKGFFKKEGVHFKELPPELDQKLATLLKQWGFAQGEDGVFSRYDKSGALIQIRLGTHSSSFSSSPGHIQYQKESGVASSCQGYVSLSEECIYLQSLQGIVFVVGHELGHIPSFLDNPSYVQADLKSFLNKLYHNPFLQSIELDADIYSIELSGSTVGAVEFFKGYVQQERSAQELRKNEKTAAFGLSFLAAAISGLSPVTAAIPILWYGSVSIYEALMRTHPLSSKRVAYLNEYAKKQGWERHETEDGSEYYDRPESKEQA